jgi:lysine-ketoglutarate reductase/saccharopine dehydrogenase-like protein (TIGR00300 family)
MKPISEEITLEGHIIDSWSLPRVWDRIMDHGGEFELVEIRVGRQKEETSFAHMKVFTDTVAEMDALLEALTELGAVVVSPDDVKTEPAPRDGALPDDFYSTTNLPTQVRIGGRWLAVANTEMDLVIMLDRANNSAAMIPMTDVKQGDAVVVGHGGIRVQPLARSRDKEIFSFMNADVSSERPKRLVISQVAREMQATRARGAKILFVGGPAIVHSGAAPYLAQLIRAGYIQVLFGGNALAVHDCEAAIFGTSLGVALHTGQPVEGGHRHHMRVINLIRRAGGLRDAVAQGILKSGIMYEAVTANIEMVLGGSVRDDGPLPDVVTDMLEVQKQMRAAVRGVELALMVSSMLHSIATGNMLPAWVKTVAVDINPAVVTKLADRGTFQALGLVTDAELFLRELVEELGLSNED